MTKISVAMATYNGEEFIVPQLQSLLNQTRQPDEVIICDDCSTDKTVELIQRFIKVNRLKNWMLLKNDSNLGYVRNFRKAMALTTGNIVFLSDQDDVWCNDKISVMTAMLEEHPQIEALVCGYCAVDVEGIPLNPQPSKFYTPRTKEEIESPADSARILYRNMAQGCAGAYRKEIVDTYTKAETSNILPHDWALNMLAYEHGGLFFLNRELLHYRIHSHNVTGVATQSRINTLLKDVGALEDSRNLPLSHDSAYELERIIQFYQIRVQWLQTKKLSIWFGGLFRFLPLIIRAFFWQYLKDLVSCFQGDVSGVKTA